MGTLFLVATPIGNLEDMTGRAVRTLRDVSLIAAEDTRRTGQLLKHFGIATPMVSYHAHNERSRREHLLRVLHEGDLALVSDAGTPGISDPGLDLVRSAIAAGFVVSPIPGASALAAAVGTSGLIPGPFVMLGFLPRRGPERRRLIRVASDSGLPVVLFESAERLGASLFELSTAWGERPAAVLREMTKLHEEVLRGPLGELAIRLKAAPVRGEVVVVVGEGSAPPAVSEAEVERLLSELRRSELTPSAAAREASRITGLPRSDLYRLARLGKPLGGEGGNSPSVELKPEQDEN